MKKILAIFIILVSLVFSSCLDYSLPKKIQLGVKGSMNLPIKTSISNWGSILAKVLKKSFSGDDEDMVKVEIYDVNYGQNVQAFCVYMPITMSDSLNPGDYLDGIAELTKTTLDGMVPLEINYTFDVPSFNDFPIDCDVESPDIPIPLGMVSFPVYAPGISIPVHKEIDLGTSLTAEFLHAQIKEGTFEINLNLSSEGDIFLADNEFDEEYDITITQGPDSESLGSSSVNPYYGLSYSALGNQDLVNQNLNKKLITVDGHVNLKPRNGTIGNVNVRNPGASSGKLSGKLNIKMNIKEFAKLDLNIENITHEMDADSLSLESVADVLNWIKFDSSYDPSGNPYFGADGEPKQGIGINVNFTEVIKGLAMSVTCDALDFSHAATPLQLGNNVFGNKEEYTLYLNAYEIPPTPPDLKAYTALDFAITLCSSDSTKPNVLTLEDVKTGESLGITGEARLYQNWKEAEVNMAAVLKANPVDDAFEGTFPDPENSGDPIDLSMLDDYIEGFGFAKEDLIAEAYLSGPDKTINGNPSLLDAIDPSLLIEAQYNGTSSLVMRKNPIALEKQHIVLKGNSDYLNKIDKDGNGTYKKASLPPDGNEFDFLDAINARPKDLVFHYKVDLPDKIRVKPEMFVDENDESVAHDIVATIILLMHMRLTAGPDGGHIKYPDMFGDQKDLLGRESLEDDSMFTSLDVSYIKFAIDFAGTFFKGGRLFIEKNNDTYQPILFPKGIRVDGSKVAINITNKDFDKVKKNLIDPDLRLEFAKGATITIPRKMGLTSIKIEAKGKVPVDLDNLDF